MSLRDWFSGPDAAEVRAEIWWLGARYQGEPLTGVHQELKGTDLSPGRARLLRACLRELKARPAAVR